MRSSTYKNALLGNRYKLIRIIGEGGYGRVWLAHDIFIKKEVAVKIYKESVPCDILKKVVDAHTINNSLNHRCIFPSYDINYEEDCLYLVMPFCPLGSIDKLSGKVSEETLWRIIKDVASGLEYLHNNGIIHLDIKPANILNDPQGFYLISDFEMYSLAVSLTHNYENAITIGGIAYMSPEKSVRYLNIDFKSDIWSLGVSIYELATGELPFNGRGGGRQLSDRILTLQCDRCSTRLSNLINACISIDPQKRPSASEIVMLADAVIAGNNDMPLLDVTTDSTILPQECLYHNTYNETILDAKSRYSIAKSMDKSLYGIIDDKGNIVVDFIYDEINTIGEFCWPSPGPGLRVDQFFIGAFFRQGEDVGYLMIQPDGSMIEYRRCSSERFRELCILT